MAKNRPYEHIKSQKKIKEADAYQCIVCGSTHASRGHHLIFFCEGGSSALNNFTTLCDTCHKKYHSGKLNIDIYRF